MLKFHERNFDNSVGESRFCTSSKEHIFLACEAFSEAQGRRREGRTPPIELSHFHPWHFNIYILVYFGSVIALQSLVGVFTGHLSSASRAPLVLVASTLGIASFF